MQEDQGRFSDFGIGGEVTHSKTAICARFRGHAREDAGCAAVRGLDFGSLDVPGPVEPVARPGAANLPPM